MDSSQLRPCPCCSQSISYEAEFCPHCGKSFRKHHSVFYYVCAVIGSLILIGILAWVGFFFLVVVPATSLARQEEQRAEQLHACESNLKTLGMSLKSWQMAHNASFPFNVSTNNGGSLEYCGRDANGVDTNSLRHFLVISNEVYPQLLMCPGAGGAALGWADMSQTKLSYHLHSAREGDLNPEGILAFCPVHRLLLRCSGEVHRAWTSEAEEERNALDSDKTTKEGELAEQAKRQRETQERARERVSSEQQMTQWKWQSEAERVRLGVAHEWTFKTGKSFTAQFASVQGTNLVVKVRDGYDGQLQETFKIYNIGISQLSEHDQRLVAELLRTQVRPLRYGVQ
jgi:hypothetical protein